MSKIFLSDYPHLLSEIDWEKNDSTLNTKAIRRGSEKILFWKCHKGHSWSTKVYKRTQGQNCPYCSNKKILQGYNDFFTTIPSAKLLWDFDKNSLNPLTLTQASSKIAFWKCENGHQWESKICNIVKSLKFNNDPCAFCSGRKVIKGKNSLGDLYPHLAEQWFEYKQDTSIGPFDVHCRSSKMISWKCSLGHIWDAKITGRVSQKIGCPYCSNHKKLKGFNDMPTTHPQLMEEWDYDKNTDIDPTTLSYGSEKLVWWKCHKGHSWQGIIKSRADGGKCPLCSHRIVIPGVNDFMTEYPSIISEIHPIKNDIKSLQNLAGGSKKKIWWVCDKGHEWEAIIKSRIFLETQCHVCNNNGTSRLEEELYNFVKDIMSDNYVIVRNSRSIISPYELDIYIPELKIAIEFNGNYWHSDDMIKENPGKWSNAEGYHRYKYNLCSENGIELLFVWEYDWKNNIYTVKKDLYNILFYGDSSLDFFQKFSVYDVIGDYCD